MPFEITRTEADDGSIEYSESEKSAVETIGTAAMMPLSALSSNNEYVSKQVAGMTALGYAAAGFAAGDKFGDDVPVLGQRR